MEVKEHLVSLKVMRLLKPSMYCTLPVYSETTSNNFSDFLIDQAFDLNSNSAQMNISADFSQTDFLVIPQTFGNLYIGETFTCYICLYNQSIHKVKELSIKLELQTTNMKIPLKFNSSKSDYADEFEPDQKFDGIVEHDVKELGNHILICMVGYVNEKGEKMSFKKFYKFLVSKPFEIQPSYPFDKSDYSSESNQDLIFQAQIQNTTSNYLLMDQVQLQPIKSNIEISRLEAEKQSESELNTSEILKPLEVKQYLFKVKYDQLEKEEKPLIGKLDISWRYSFGEHGHLQTHPLGPPVEYTNKLHNDIELKFQRNSKEFYLENEILIICEIKNKSDRELDLLMKLENSENNERITFLWNCELIHQIGCLSPNESHFIELSVVPLRTGILRLSGITITDLFLKRKHEFSPVLNIFVVPKQDNTSLMKEDFSE
ncbi:unnamed protein product, partial [Brachionus calyciflorus]